MASAANVQLGVCTVSINGVDIGHTKDGVEFSYEPVYKDVTVDQYGETPVDSRLIGEQVMVKFKIAEYTLANLGIAIPFGQYAGAANARRTFGAAAGKKASDVYVQAVFHPKDEGTRRYDLVLYKAMVHSAIAISFKNDEERVIEVELQAYVDETKSDRNYLGLLGDSTA